MKNLLTIAIVLSTATAFATRSRNASLGNSAHLADFYSPENIANSGDSLTIETGLTNVTTASGINSGAEGTLHKSMFGGVLGLSLGHQDGMIFGNRATSGLAGITTQQNPIELAYGMKMGDMAIGAGLLYSNYEDKVSTEKESSMGVKIGVATPLFYAHAKIIAGDKYEKAASNYKGATGFDLTGGMNFGDMSLHANVNSSGYKVNDGAIADVSSMGMSLKVVDQIKKDGNNFFYGAGLAMTNSKDKVPDSKEDTLNLPLIIGLEATANSWLTLRASVTQDVMLSNDKVTNTTTPANNKETNPGLNTTTFAAGAGLVFNKVTIDGAITTVSGSQSQNLNANNLLANVGLTYNF